MIPCKKTDTHQSSILNRKRTVIMTRGKEFFCENCPSGFQNHFNLLDKDDLQHLNEEKTTGFYKKGNIIYQEGQKTSGLYCVRDGKIKVYKNDLDGREHIVRIVLPGEFMGLKALLSGNPHSVSAAAFEDSSVCMISKSDFFHFMIKYPGFNQSIIIYLSKLLDDAEKRMLSLAFKPVRERLAEILVFLFTSFYPGVKTPTENYLNLTRMDLANIIGTAQETIIRLLSEFREEGLIEIRGRKIFLLDMIKLTIIANQKG